jgi:hypothetical protein
VAEVERSKPPGKRDLWGRLYNSGLMGIVVCEASFG